MRFFQSVVVLTAAKFLLYLLVFQNLSGDWRSGRVPGEASRRSIAEASWSDQTVLLRRIDNPAPPQSRFRPGLQYFSQ